MPFAVCHRNRFRDNLATKRDDISNKIKTMYERQAVIKDSKDERKEEILELIDIELINLEKSLNTLQLSNPAVDIALAGLASNVLHVLSANNQESKILFNIIRSTIFPQTTIVQPSHNHSGYKVSSFSSFSSYSSTSASWSTPTQSRNNYERTERDTKL